MDDTGDPGEMSTGKIFHIYCEKDKKDGYLDLLNIYPRRTCYKGFKTQTVSSLDKYIETRGSSNEYKTTKSFEAEFGLKMGGFGVNLETSAAFANSGSSEDEGIKKLFEEKKGEITIAIAKCYLQIVTFKSFYRPKFDRGFIRALEDIDDTRTR